MVSKGNHGTGRNTGRTLVGEDRGADAVRRYDGWRGRSRGEQEGRALHDDGNVMRERQVTLTDDTVAIYFVRGSLNTSGMFSTCHSCQRRRLVALLKVSSGRQCLLLDWLLLCSCCPAAPDEQVPWEGGVAYRRGETRLGCVSQGASMALASLRAAVAAVNLDKVAQWQWQWQ